MNLIAPNIRVHSRSFVVLHCRFLVYKGNGLRVIDYDEDEEGQRPRRGDPPRLTANSAPAPLVPSAGRYATRRATPVTNCLYGVIGQVAGVDVGTSRRADPDQSPSPARLSR